MATIWLENKFSICQPMTLVKGYSKNPTLLMPLCKRTALDVGVESFFSIVKTQGPRNPFIASPILNFSPMKRQQKIYFFPLQVQHQYPAPLNVTCKHKWTVCLDGRHTTTSSVNAFLRKHGGHFDVTMFLQKSANIELDINIFQDLISRILHVTNPRCSSIAIGVSKECKLVINKACTMPWCHTLVHFEVKTSRF